MGIDRSGDFKMALSRDQHMRRQSMRIYMDKDLYLWIRAIAKDRIIDMGIVINRMLREIYDEKSKGSGQT